MSYKKQNEKCSNKILFLIATLLYVMHLSATDTTQYELEEINVDANTTKSSNDGVLTKTDSFGGKNTITRELIDATPARNGDITSLLRGNPSVKFSNSNKRSTTMGEIDPADISINGAQYYQNNFMIDGMNINNDLDPSGNKGYSHRNANNIWNPISSASQGMSIDSDFVESIDVYDSDISAKYGSFTGGVVDAKTRNPRAGFHGKISMSHTRDSWTKYHINNEESTNGNTADDFKNSADASNQPYFKKYTTRLNLEGFLTDDLGFLFGYTNTRSTIPLKTYASTSTNGNYVNQISKQRRNIDNYFLKTLWYATDRLTITPSITYAPQTAKVYRKLAKDSFMDQTSGGLTLNLKTDYDLDFMKISQQISYSKLETSRDSANQYSNSWKYSDAKDWGVPTGNSFEGAFGDINQEQKTINYNLDLEFNEFEALWAKHKFITGFEIKRQDVFYEIPKEFTAAGQPRSLNGNNCEAGDPYCSKDSSFGGNGQYLAYLQVYGPGKVGLKTTSWAYYLEDKINIGNLTIRPGVRISGDDYMDKKTIAPRFSTSYDIFGDDSTIIAFGRNRYYGRNMFSYVLTDGRLSLVKYYRRTQPTISSWNQEGSGVNDTYFRQLDIPYDDETSYSITQQFADFTLGVKYIDRKARDIVTRSRANAVGVTCDTTNGYSRACYTYSNNGWRDTKTWNVTLKNTKPLKIYNTDHNIEIAYSNLKQKRNASVYSSSIDEDIINNNKIVYYDGKLINYNELPVNDFADPWVLTATTVSHIPQANLTISNFLNYRGSTDATARTGTQRINGNSYDKYEKVKLGKRYTWDMRINYTHKLPKDITAFINLDITNILDRVNKAQTATTTSTAVAYEAGRQFWLEAGLKW
ncbi:TonB-dependent receptor plug domain-containing protein [Campylobacter sp. faydin G-105]|uniref:TonB-dependent receptor plug domain-containing protein n=1 Tax=Campylobacter anatolicus TaxID=2829105 RepID=UPI001B94D4CF|nr:TonB-dependent receptor [Campylobacter anatolicus]MBR8462391.1 TonB-dependent receptor plug domain-containing protein [Campylobacter anatolicus]